jgi:hypothetical protein
MKNLDKNKFIENLYNDTGLDEDFAKKLKAANLYLTAYSEEYPGRIEKVYPDGRIELCPIGMTLMEARVQQREDAQKAGLSGII